MCICGVSAILQIHFLMTFEAHNVKIQACIKKDFGLETHYTKFSSFGENNQ